MNINLLPTGQHRRSKEWGNEWPLLLAAAVCAAIVVGLGWALVTL